MEKFVKKNWYWLLLLAVHSRQMYLHRDCEQCQEADLLHMVLDLDHLYPAR